MNEEYKEFEVIEKLLLSNYDNKYLEEKGITLNEVEEFKKMLSEKLKPLEEVKYSPLSKDFIYVFHLANMYASLEYTNNNRTDLLAKVAALLEAKIIRTSINNYIKSIAIKTQKTRPNKIERDLLFENLLSFIYSTLKYIDIYSIINILFPYLYSEDEIEKLDDLITNHINNDDYDAVLDILKDFFKDIDDRKNNVYKNEREYDAAQNDAFLKNEIVSREDSNRSISESVKDFIQTIKISKYLVIHYQDEYESWKYLESEHKSLTAFINRKYLYFLCYNYYIDGKYTYYFFETLNEPQAFAKDQIDYIREMAPKLRISSYLNEEYAKYKKLYNPDAREFDFGVDEPEEETTIEEQLLPESEQIEDEKKEKLHLGPLSHFTKPKLIKLLEKFRDRKEPFVHKETKNKNWLFVFGMNGDTPPQGFKKIKWEAKHNGRIAKGALIDFLELLGYDINQLYEVDSIKILNECFECYNPDNKLVPIDQNDFHYKKRTKERDHSKTFYDHFKRIIENIEKEA